VCDWVANYSYRGRACALPFLEGKNTWNIAVLVDNRMRVRYQFYTYTIHFSLKRTLCSRPPEPRHALPATSLAVPPAGRCSWLGPWP